MKRHSSVSSTLSWASPTVAGASGVVAVVSGSVEEDGEDMRVVSMGSTTPSTSNATATMAQLSQGHQHKLFSASRIQRGTSAFESLAIGDISSVASLRKEMTHAQHIREELKQLIDDSQYLVTTHHGQYALENVTLYRETESLREQVLAKEERIRRLKKEVELAEQEHARLQEVNAKLLQGMREKDREKSRVVVRLESHEYCERHTHEFGESVTKRTAELHGAKGEVAGATTSLVSKLGKHHSEVMVLEQEMLDLKLEADLLRSRLGLVFDGAAQRSNQWYFRSCENAQCIRDRQNLRQSKERLRLIEETLRLTGNLKGLATPTHMSQTLDTHRSSATSGVGSDDQAFTPKALSFPFR